MEVMQFVDDTKRLWAHYQAAQNRWLALLPHAHQFFYQSVTLDGDDYSLDDALAGLNAMEAIGQHVRELYYPGEKLTKRNVHRFMLVQAQPELIEATQSLNTIKQVFNLQHGYIRSHYDHAVTRTRAITNVLNKIGEYKLNLDAVDRHIPFMMQTPAKVAWFINVTQVSQRRTVADAITHLAKRLDGDLTDNHREATTQAIVELQGLPKAQPVSQRKRAPVVALKVRGSGKNHLGQRSRFVDYGVNPLVIPHDAQQEITLVLPKQYGGIDSKPGQGRKPTVSDQALSPVLPDWFFYEADICKP